MYTPYPSQSEGQQAVPLVFQQTVIVNLLYTAKEDQIRRLGKKIIV